MQGPGAMRESDMRRDELRAYGAHAQASAGSQEEG